MALPAGLIYDDEGTQAAPFVYDDDGSTVAFDSPTGLADLRVRNAIAESQPEAQLAPEDPKARYAYQEPEPTISPLGKRQSGASSDFGETTIMQDEPAPQGYLAQGVNKARNLMGLDQIQPHLSDSDRARAVTQLQAQEEGVPYSQYRNASEIPEQFAAGAVGGFSGGLIPAVSEATTGESFSNEPATTGGQIAQGAGQLAGALTGLPAAASKLMPPIFDVSKTTPTWERLGKEVANQATNMVPFMMASKAGETLQKANLGEAFDTQLQAATDGIITGAIFGGAKGLIPEGGVANSLKRIATGLTAFEAEKYARNPQNGVPMFDDRPVQQKVYETLLDSWFLSKGMPELRGLNSTEKSLAVQDIDGMKRNGMSDGDILKTVKAKYGTSSQQYQSAKADMIQSRMSVEKPVSAKSPTEVESDISEMSRKFREDRGAVTDPTADAAIKADLQGATTEDLQDYRDYLVQNGQSTGIIDAELAARNEAINPVIESPQPAVPPVEAAPTLEQPQAVETMPPNTALQPQNGPTIDDQAQGVTGVPLATETAEIAPVEQEVVTPAPVTNTLTNTPPDLSEGEAEADGMRPSQLRARYNALEAERERLLQERLRAKQQPALPLPRKQPTPIKINGVPIPVRPVQGGIDITHPIVDEKSYYVLRTKKATDVVGDEETERDYVKVDGSPVEIEGFTGVDLFSAPMGKQTTGIYEGRTGVLVGYGSNLDDAIANTRSSIKKPHTLYRSIANTIRQRGYSPRYGGTVNTSGTYGSIIKILDFARATKSKVLPIYKIPNKLRESLRRSLINQQPGRSIINELFQNSLDAVQTLKPSDRAIDITSDSTWSRDYFFLQNGEKLDVPEALRSSSDGVNFMEFKDNGIGMSGATLQREFFSIADDSIKTGEQSRGGYGQAKLVFVMTPDYFRVETVAKVGGKKVKSTAGGLRSDYENAPVKITSDEVSDDTPTGTSIAFMFKGGSDGTVSQYDLNDAVEFYSNNLRTPVKLTVGGKNVEPIKGFKDYDSVIPSQKIEKDGNEIEIKYVPSEPYGYDWNGIYTVDTIVLNDGLPLQVGNISNVSINTKPTFKIYINFNKTVKVEDSNYPFIKNRTEVLNDLAKEIDREINASMDAVRANVHKRAVQKLKEQLANATRLQNGTRVINHFEHNFLKAESLIDDNKVMLNDFSKLFLQFNDLLESVGEKITNTDICLDMGVHGWRPRKSLGYENTQALNPFAITQSFAKGGDTPTNYASNLIHTMIHEYAHINEENHHASFSSEVGRLYAILSHRELSKLEDIAHEIYKKHIDGIRGFSDSLQEYSKQESGISSISSEETGNSSKAYYAGDIERKRIPTANVSGNETPNRNGLSQPPTPTPHDNTPAVNVQKEGSPHQIGKAWINGQWRPITATRTITKGKQGYIEVTFGKANQTKVLKADAVKMEEPKYSAALASNPPLNGVSNSTKVKSLSDGIVADAKQVADFVNTKSFIEKGFNGFNIPMQRSQLGRMGRLIENDEIRKSVVESIPVDMMDVLASKKLSSDTLLHDKSVLRNLLSVDGYNPISLPIGAASRLANVVAVSAAKVTKLPVSNGSLSSLKGQAAPITGQGDLVASTSDRAMKMDGSVGPVIFNETNLTASGTNNIFHNTSFKKTVGNIIPDNEIIATKKTFNDKDISLADKSHGKSDRATLQASLDRKMGDWATTVKVVQKQADLPQNVLDDIEAKGGGIVEAVTVGDTITVVADNVSPARGVLLAATHEAVHVGLEGVLGEQYSPIMAETRKALGLDDISDSETQEHVAELAEGADYAKRLWGRIVNALRNFMRKLGVKLDLKKSELYGIIDKAIRYAKNGERLEPNGAIIEAYSKKQKGDNGVSSGRQQNEILLQQRRADGQVPNVDAGRKKEGLFPALGVEMRVVPRSPNKGTDAQPSGRPTRNETEEGTKYSIDRDTEYLSLASRYESGDESVLQQLQEMVTEAARKSGYISNDEYKMQHQAPDRTNENLATIMDNTVVPKDYWTHPQYYQYGGDEYSSFYKIKSAVELQKKFDADGNGKQARIWVYRAVPKTVKEDTFRNGDWVTPSYEYAKSEGAGITEGYRVIKARKRLADLWWDANSINELGFDDGNGYVYKNTKNNRKLIDVITKDAAGNIIPLSQRFNPRKDDIRYSLDKSGAGGDKLPVAGEIVDGRTVLSDTPNLSSISASFNDGEYRVLKGTREIPMSDFYLTGRSYSKSDNDRIKSLADKIKESKELKPLIVVYGEAEGPYILEGGHRADALFILKAKSFPAVVVDVSQSQPKRIDRLTSHLSNESGSVAPIWNDLVTVATEAAKQSRNNFHNFTRKMKELFATVWGKIKPHLQKLYAEAKKSLASIAKGHVGLTMDVQDRKAEIEGFKEWKAKRGKTVETPKAETVAPAKQTLIDKAKDTTVYRIYDELAKLTAPTTRGESALSAGQKINEEISRAARTKDQLVKAIAPYQKALNKLDDNGKIDFMQRMDTGQEQASKELTAIATLIDRMFKDKVAAVQELGTGALQTARENYFPHIWKKKGVVSGQQLDYTLKSKPPEGKKAFTKQRVYDDVLSGIEAGHEPVSTDPLDLVALKMSEMDKYIATHRLLQELEGQGFAKLIKPTEKADSGWIDVNTRYGIKHGNKYIVQEPVGEVINNYLSRSLYDNKYVGSLYSAYMSAGNSLNMFQLGFGAFHAGFTTGEAMVSSGAEAIDNAYRLVTFRGDMAGNAKRLGESLFSTATAPVTIPLEGNRILKAWLSNESAPAEVAKIIDAMHVAGARPYQSQFDTNHLKKLKEHYANGKYIRMALRSPFAFAELAMLPIMKQLVPRQKLGVFSLMARHVLETNPNMSHSEYTKTMRYLWNRVDARLGQVLWDRTFIHNAAKSVIQGLIRAPGWTGGTIIELGGAPIEAAKFIKDWVKSGSLPGHIPNKVSYTMSLFLINALICGSLTAMLTGEPPEGLDWLFFRTGGKDKNGDPKRFMLPMYVKDVVSYVIHPMTTLLHKMHPILSLASDIAQNKTYNNVEIFDPSDHWYQILTDMTKHFGKGYTPFSVSGVIRSNERKDPVWQQGLSMIGIQPAKREFQMSAAERKAVEYMTEHGKKEAMSKSEYERKQQNNEIRDKAKAGDINAIDAARRNGSLSKKEATIMKRSLDTPMLERSFKTLDAKEALDVYNRATDKEKQELEPLLRKKAHNYMKDGQRDKSNMIKDALNGK